MVFRVPTKTRETHPNIAPWDLQIETITRNKFSLDSLNARMLMADYMSGGTRELGFP